MRFDTPIEVTEDTGATHSDARRCGATIADKGSTIAKTLSTTETIDVEEVLEEAREIRQRCKDNETPAVVTGECKTLHVL